MLLGWNPSFKATARNVVVFFISILSKYVFASLFLGSDPSIVYLMIDSGVLVVISTLIASIKNHLLMDNLVSETNK